MKYFKLDVIQREELMQSLAGIAKFVFIASIFCQTAYATEDCNEVKGFDSILDNSQLEYLVVGELHGSAEIPAVFGSLVCSALRSGKKYSSGWSRRNR